MKTLTSLKSLDNVCVVPVMKSYIE